MTLKKNINREKTDNNDSIDPLTNCLKLNTAALSADSTPKQNDYILGARGNKILNN